MTNTVSPARVIIDTYDAKIGTSLTGSEMGDLYEAAVLALWPATLITITRNGRDSIALDADGFEVDDLTAELRRLIDQTWEGATISHPYNG
jgi:hypothetical protein